MDRNDIEQVDGSRDNAGISSSKDRRKRSKAWKEFRITEVVDGKPVKAECIHCGTLVGCEPCKGTSVLHNHLKSDSCKRKRAANEQPIDASSDGDAAPDGASVVTGHSVSRKRMRIDATLEQNSAANTYPWNRAKCSCRILEIAHQLQEAMSEVLRLYGSDFLASSNLNGSTTADPCRRTSSLVQRKMYGRVTEKNSIIKMITDKSEGVIVLPIVGIAGIGKTALAQLVYNDPIVKSKFENRVWVWLSKNFDEVTLTREMLDFVSQESYAGIKSLAKLQEMLMGHITSKRCLVILDDVWDDMNDHTWNKLLVPLKSANANGPVILATTRILSVATRIGTAGIIKLGALESYEFWSLFKACSFPDENYKGHPNLNIIGQQISEKLHGNPLAAETAGMLLREHLSIDYWNNILLTEKWKSLELNVGIMHALKLSYDQLPYHLQQCFSFCSIFPNNYPFLGNDLVRIWISQGFVRCHSSKRLEVIGQDYLTDLVNYGFLDQVERDLPPDNHKCYVLCGLMHEFASLVSKTECASIDDGKCNEIPPDIHHLSILCCSSNHKYLDGNVHENHRFEEKMQNVVLSVRKLRTLVLIGKYSNSFLQAFEDLFQKAECLRLLQITNAGFSSFLTNPENCIHLRYLKLENNGYDGALPQALSTFYHLQTLDVGKFGNSMIPAHMNSLVSLRHLNAPKGWHSSISGIGKMTSLQELHDFSVRNCRDFKITELKSMNELVQISVSQLENVTTGHEAFTARLRDKQHLEMLQLSWKDISQPDYHNNIEELIDEPMNENNPNSELSADTPRDVLESLEPHHHLKHLQISGYSGVTSPTWLGTSVTSLQSLHLEDCGEWKILPSLERLPLLTKLKLRNMREVIEVSIPSLEELGLIEMPKMERCSCKSVRDLSYSLRALQIKKCRILKAFPLFESYDNFEIEQDSWLHLSELTVHDCPHLTVLHPLPPSSMVSQLSIIRVSTLPRIEGSSFETLTISGPCLPSDESHVTLRVLDDKVLAFHNLRSLTHMIISRCRHLTFISFEGLRQLINLKCLEIQLCGELFSSRVLLKDTNEAIAVANCNTLPSLKHFKINACGISGRWLSLMLRHVLALEKLRLRWCVLTGLSVEEDISDPSYIGGTVTNSAPEGLLRIPLRLIYSLKKITIALCHNLTFQGTKDGFSAFTSLEKLKIVECPSLLFSMVSKDGNNDQASGRWLLPQSLGELEITDSPETLWPCFPGNLTFLKKLTVRNSPSLEILRLHSYTALQELRIQYCGSLAILEGLQSLTSLRHLNVYGWPGLLQCLERLSRQQDYAQCPHLENLEIDDYSVLTTSFCRNLTSLLRLELRARLKEVARLTDEQERALQLLTSLQELRFWHSYELTDLPRSLHSLTSLKRLEICYCQCILRLPERGLPPSLEELEISYCSKELSEQCRTLARKLKVKIDGEYVN
ncbi:unnamed protein product [Urochloa humidicola]